MFKTICKNFRKLAAGSAFAAATAVFATAAAANFAALPAASAADGSVTVPPLKILSEPLPNWKSGDWGAPAGKWLAATPAAALDYAKTRAAALAAEKSRDWPAALTAWERVLDRTSCSETQREEARLRVRALRQEVQPNTDPAKARKWTVLALIYKTIDFEGKTRDGKKTRFQTVMKQSDLDEIGARLGAFRDLVFLWSNGLLVLEFDTVVVEEPPKHLSGVWGGYALNIGDVGPAVKKYAKERGKKYNTIISYVNHRGGPGPNIPSPGFAAATYGIVGHFDNAGYIMVPYWSNKWPTEPLGEAELHEWLHQIDDVVHKTLGYPRGTTRSSDDGRHVGDNRPGGDHEYKKPRRVHTWCFLYRHIMQEHMTRQIWSELTTIAPHGPKPGKCIKILKNDAQ
ncbi:MAG: hypothetical protein LBR07_10095 [Puniceicoccales bacterium]|jgi:hypothetical protein|nr:hypothetical protein [Puniceicoccales bacterium]